jgi:hypothetical protein
MTFPAIISLPTNVGRGWLPRKNSKGKDQTLGEASKDWIVNVSGDHGTTTSGRRWEGIVPDVIHPEDGDGKGNTQLRLHLVWPQALKVTSSQLSIGSNCHCVGWRREDSRTVRALGEHTQEGAIGTGHTAEGHCDAVAPRRPAHGVADYANATWSTPPGTSFVLVPKTCIHNHTLGCTTPNTEVALGL